MRCKGEGGLKLIPTFFSLPNKVTGGEPSWEYVQFGMLGGRYFRDIHLHMLSNHTVIRESEILSDFFRV